MKIMLSFFLALSALPRPAAQAADSPVFDVPHLSDIHIDGDPADWGVRGFRVGVLASPEGKMRPAADLDAGFRLGWDQDGLLLLLAVSDDVGDETPDEGALWTKDSVELFMAARQGSSEYYQLVIAPGFDSKYPALRHAFYDHRSTKVSQDLQISAVRTTTRTGYILEICFPWQNLALPRQSGAEFAFQLYVNDSEGSEGRFQATWFPRDGTHADPTAMHRVRLAVTSSPPVVAAANGAYHNLDRTQIEVVAVGDLVDKKVEIREGAKVLAAGVLEAEGSRAQVQFSLPMPSRGQAYGLLAVLVDGQPVSTVDLPNPDEQRARALMDIEVHCRPSVFSGTELPGCGPVQPAWAEDLTGPYEIKTTYYDREYNPITTATKPGRYGAVVEIVAEQGRPVRRFRTLFRQPEELDWWRYEMKASLELPSQLGVDPTVVREQASAVAEFLKWRLVDGFDRDNGTAALLAGLYETAPGSGALGASGNIWAQDRQWWVGLKRRLYALDQVYPRPLVCPQLLVGSPAPVLRPGSPQEAGVKPEGVARIDSLCRVWAAASDEGFAVCLARHGVIFLHQAYGQRQGRPMTVDDPSWMASITKLLSGTLMMMLVDQGRVDLDDPVERFLPPLRGIQVQTPLTIRHLYTHTNGLWGHWGDDLNDFEQIVADYYPYLEVGKRHSYNGAGYAVGGKVIEMVSGEAIPQFYKEHLLDPLGCTGTRVTDTSGGSQSIPLDIAKVGQMLLNRGAYGQLRFFRAETLARMLPVRLTQVLGPDTQIEWGIGTTWFTEPGLAEGTFGHGAASAATLRINPADDLIIVMTRNAGGTHFSEYHPQFIAVVAAALAE